MRIGIISFINPDITAPELAVQASLVKTLSGRQHDVITANLPVSTKAQAVSEAERLARADCDGVLLIVEGGESPDLATQALLRLQSPALLVGTFAPPFFDAAGTLAEIGQPCERLLLSGDYHKDADEIHQWLGEHSKLARQQGTQAAQLLYGQRCAIMVERTSVVDTSQWLTQLGVHVTDFPLSTVEAWMEHVAPERVDTLTNWLDFPPDGRHDLEVQLYLAVKDVCMGDHLAFCSLPDLVDGIKTDLARSLMNDVVDAEGEKRSVVCCGGGDANGALTMQLLHLVSNEPVLTAALGTYHADNERFDLLMTNGGFPRSLVATAPEVTFARITRRAGRFQCLLLNGALPGDNLNPTANFACDPSRLFDTLLSGYLHAVPGNRIGAMRAACEALDIEPIVLR